MLAAGQDNAEDIGAAVARYNKLVLLVVSGVGMLMGLTLLTPISARASVYLLMAVQALKGFASVRHYD